MNPRWWRHDSALRAAMIVAVVLRLALSLAWIDKPCVRDECVYEALAKGIVHGEGMVAMKGWLWAPGYPTLMAIHGFLTGFPATVQVTQALASAAIVFLLHRLGERRFDRGTGRIAAWMWALNPTMIFYSASQWSETVYTLLLVGGIAAVDHARARARDDHGRAAVPVGAGLAGLGVGALVGACVLFRGVAVAILPIFVVGLLWQRWRDRRAWTAAAACVVASVVVVAPYSAWATQRFGGLVVSDRTLGQMMWLGNNDFAPMTFDWGNGVRDEAEMQAVAATGRPHCATPRRVVRQDACEVTAGRAWIAAHPGEFLRRVPLRLAQLAHPHTFLTRHLRERPEPGLPALLVETIVVSVVGFSVLGVLGGAVGWSAWAAGRVPGGALRPVSADTGGSGAADGCKGPRPPRSGEGVTGGGAPPPVPCTTGWSRPNGEAQSASVPETDSAWLDATTGLVVLYHAAAIGVLAGLSRYRVPLEAPVSLYAAALVAHPRATWRHLTDGSARSLMAVLGLAVLAALVAWFLPAGWSPPR